MNLPTSIVFVPTKLSVKDWFIVIPAILAMVTSVITFFVMAFIDSSKKNTASTTPDPVKEIVERQITEYKKFSDLLVKAEEVTPKPEQMDKSMPLIPGSAREMIRTVSHYWEPGTERFLPEEDMGKTILRAIASETLASPKGYVMEPVLVQWFLDRQVKDFAIWTWKEGEWRLEGWWMDSTVLHPEIILEEKE